MAIDYIGWIKKGLEKKGKTQLGIAEALNIAHPQITQLLKGDRRLKVDELEAISRYLEIPVPGSSAPDTVLVPIIGTAKAGAFEDITLYSQDPDDVEYITSAKDRRFPHCDPYALKVVGDSMNNLFPEGYHVLCVSFDQCGIEVKSGQIVHVERIQGHLVETTVKRLRIEGEKFLLDPDSTNKNHTTIELNGDDSTEIIIKGLVIGAHQSIPV